MNSSFDIASIQSEAATRVPFPPEQRVNVFVATNYGAVSDRLRRQWFRWGGETEFVFPNASLERCQKCGVAIFETGTCEFPMAVFDVLCRGGDVFQYCPVRENFQRVDVDTFKLFYFRK